MGEEKPDGFLEASGNLTTVRPKKTQKEKERESPMANNTLGQDGETDSELPEEKGDSEDLGLECEPCEDKIMGNLEEEADRPKVRRQPTLA